MGSTGVLMPLGGWHRYALVLAPIKQKNKMARMHKDEIGLTISDLAELIRIQFPQWANLPIKNIKSFGTVNTIYKLGENYCIRVPKIFSGVQQIEKEEKWLPFFRTKLPIKIPKLIETGSGNQNYPWNWACLLYTSPSPRDATLSRMPSSA